MASGHVQLQFMNVHSLTEDEVINVLDHVGIEMQHYQIVCRRHRDREDTIHARCHQDDFNPLMRSLNAAMKTVARPEPDSAPLQAANEEDGGNEAVVPLSAKMVVKHLVNPTGNQSHSIRLVRICDLRDAWWGRSIVLPKKLRLELPVAGVLRAMRWDERAKLQELGVVDYQMVTEEVRRRIPDIFGSQRFADCGRDMDLSGQVSMMDRGDNVLGWLDNSAQPLHRVDRKSLAAARLPSHGSPGGSLRSAVRLNYDANGTLVEKHELHGLANRGLADVPPTPKAGSLKLPPVSPERTFKTYAQLSRMSRKTDNKRSAPPIPWSDDESGHPGRQTGHSEPPTEQQQLTGKFIATMRQCIVKAKDASGPLGLEFRLGRILIRNLDNVQISTAGFATDWANDFEAHELSNPSASYFTDRIVTEARELGVVFKTLLAGQTMDKSRLAENQNEPYKWSREWDIELVCEDWQGREVTVTIDGESMSDTLTIGRKPRYHLCLPKKELATVLVHHPKYVHDAKFVLTETEDPASRHVRPEAVRELINNLTVRMNEAGGDASRTSASPGSPAQAAQTAAKWFQRAGLPAYISTKSARLDLRVEHIRLRRESSYLMPGWAPLVARFTEHVDMQMMQRPGGQVLGYMGDRGVMVREGLVWQEFALVVPDGASDFDDDEQVADGAEDDDNGTDEEEKRMGHDDETESEQDERAGGETKKNKNGNRTMARLKILGGRRLLSWLEFSARRIVQGADAIGHGTLDGESSAAAGGTPGSVTVTAATAPMGTACSGGQALRSENLKKLDGDAGSLLERKGNVKGSKGFTLW